MLDLDFPDEDFEEDDVSPSDKPPIHIVVFSDSRFLILPLVFGLFAFACAVAASFVLAPTQSGSFLSYGQQWGLISLPICTGVGIAIGTAIAFALVRRDLIAFAVLLTASLMSGSAILTMWDNQIARHGRDPSEIVLYYPPLLCSLLAFVVAVILGMIGAVRYCVHPESTDEL